MITAATGVPVPDIESVSRLLSGEFYLPPIISLLGPYKRAYSRWKRYRPNIVEYDRDPEQLEDNRMTVFPGLRRLHRSL